MFAIIVIYMILRYASLEAQYTFRIIYTVWFFICILVMCIHLAIIFYQMNQLMRHSQQQSVKNVQKRVSYTINAKMFICSFSSLS